MSRRVMILAVVAVLLVGGLVAGLVAARAQSATKLPALKPAELLSKIATAAGNTTSVSGPFTWSNGLIPAADLAGITGGQGGAPAGIASLFMGGSGRLWLQKGSGARFAVQGNGGDLVLVAGKNGVWAYSSAANTAMQFTLPAGHGLPGAGLSALRSPVSNLINPLAIITLKLHQLAPTATVAVSGQEQVAGRQSYILTLTPTSQTTIFGSAQVAVDGTTFVPLRVQIFAKGAGKPALSAGFTSVSYGKIDASLFTFTPPAGATIKHQAIVLRGKLDAGAAKMRPLLGKREAPLTLAQAIAKAKGLGLTLSVPTQGSLPASLAFKGAAVMAPAKAHGVVAMLHFGSGFGSVVLVEAQSAAGQAAKATWQQQVAKLPQGLLTKTTVSGAKGYELSTSLFNAVAWQQGKVTLVAAGSVAQTTVDQLAGSLH